MFKGKRTYPPLLIASLAWLLACEPALHQQSVKQSSLTDDGGASSDPRDPLISGNTTTVDELASVFDDEGIEELIEHVGPMVLEWHDEAADDPEVTFAQVHRKKTHTENGIEELFNSLYSSGRIHVSPEMLDVKKTLQRVATGVGPGGRAGMIVEREDSGLHKFLETVICDVNEATCSMPLPVVSGGIVALVTFEINKSSKEVSVEVPEKRIDRYAYVWANPKAFEGYTHDFDTWAQEAIHAPDASTLSLKAATAGMAVYVSRFLGYRTFGRRLKVNSGVGHVLSSLNKLLPKVFPYDLASLTMPESYTNLNHAYLKALRAQRSVAIYSMVGKGLWPNSTYRTALTDRNWERAAAEFLVHDNGDLAQAAGIGISDSDLDWWRQRTSSTGKGNKTSSLLRERVQELVIKELAQEAAPKDPERLRQIVSQFTEAVEAARKTHGNKFGIYQPKLENENVKLTRQYNLGPVSRFIESLPEPKTGVIGKGPLAKVVTNGLGVIAFLLADVALDAYFNQENYRAAVCSDDKWNTGSWLATKGPRRSTYEYLLEYLVTGNKDATPDQNAFSDHGNEKAMHELDKAAINNEFREKSEVPEALLADGRIYYCAPLAFDAEQKKYVRGNHPVFANKNVFGDRCNPYLDYRMAQLLRHYAETGKLQLEKRSWSSGVRDYFNFRWDPRDSRWFFKYQEHTVPSGNGRQRVQTEKSEATPDMTPMFKYLVRRLVNGTATLEEDENEDLFHLHNMVVREFGFVPGSLANSHWHNIAIEHVSNVDLGWLQQQMALRPVKKEDGSPSYEVALTCKRPI